MLVLTRKNCQQIQIGNDIVITILQVSGRSVRVGIDAPRTVRVVRAELLAEDAENANQETNTVGTQLPQEAVEPNEMPSFMSLSQDERLALTTLAKPRSSGGLANYMRRRDPSAKLHDNSVRRPARLGPSTLRSVVGAMR